MFPMRGNLAARVHPFLRAHFNREIGESQFHANAAGECCRRRGEFPCHAIRGCRTA